MSRRAIVSPAWMDRLLVGWGLKSLHQHGAGWYSLCPMLRDGIPTGRPPGELYELGGEDYAALDAAINALPLIQRAAVSRAYKPWTAASIDQVEPASRQTWCERLKSAAVTLELAMRRKPLAQPEELDYSADIP